MAFLVAGVWRPRGQLNYPDDVVEAVSTRTGNEVTDGVIHDATAAPTGAIPGPVGDGVENSVPDLAARVAALQLDGPSEDVAAVSRRADGAAAVNAGFDWAAYRAIWNDTPIDEAITAMFAEFAVLHAELCGQVRSTVPVPLTLDVGKHIADRAERFVTMYMTPILGPSESVKVHKLLCHVMDAIRLHGNVNNGNSSLNEQKHKEDKPYYARTNRDRMDFTRQIVVQAQGAHVIQERISNAQAAQTSLASVANEEDGECDGPPSDDDANPLDVHDGDGARRAALPGAASAAAQGVLLAAPTADADKRTIAHHLRMERLSTMESIPGLAGITAALKLPQDASVRVCSYVKLDAVFDCGTAVSQLLYASPSFRGESWYDHVQFCPSPDRTLVAVAEVRAIVRRPEGDVAVIAEMEVVESVAGCPLTARGCTRLAWSVPEGREDVCLRAIPVKSIRRLLHVVPDFADLVGRLGVDAEPAAVSAPARARLAMRFFVNAFYPWGASS